jgi:hypothetical protein
VVQELGWDNDADDDVRVTIEDAIGRRDGGGRRRGRRSGAAVVARRDGDLGDGLMEALTDLTDSGYIWLMTPKVGRSGYIDAADIAEAAVAAAWP